MRKRLLAFTMCAALAAGSLYGCAPEDGAGRAQTTKAGTQAQPSDGTQAEAGATEAAKAEVNEELSGDLVFAI